MNVEPQVSSEPATMSTTTPVPRPSAGRPVQGAVPITPVGSYSSSAFCAGGTVGPGEPANSTIYLTNTSDRAVQGVMTSVVAPGTGAGTSGNSGGSGAPAVLRRVEVPASGAAAINPGTGLGAGYEATSLTFAGGGVAVNQVVSGTGGWSTAPCASQPSSSWYFAGGSTAKGNALTLALSNPAATSAVVDVSFLTSAGVIAPPGYQGLVVAPGRLVTENVGDFVQNQTGIATIVSAQSGGVVADQLQQWSAPPTGGLALQLGSPTLSTVWQFAQTTSSPGAAVTFYLANPGRAAATASIGIGLSMGSVVPVRVSVPGQSVAMFVASSAARLPSQIPYSVTVHASAAIVVGRSVEAARGATPPVWGSSIGVASAATHWWVPAPGVINAPGIAGATVTSMAVANPGPTPAHVVVTTPGTSRPVASFIVKPGSLGVLGSPLVDGLHAYDVRSTQAVTVEEDDRPAGAAGIVSSTGLPFAG